MNINTTATLWSVLLIASSLGACSPKTSPITGPEPVEAPAPEPNPEDGITGNDRDEHGCIATAGYEWSQLRNECIRVFEVGMMLDPAGSSSSVCYLVSGSGGIWEAYMVEVDGSIILQRQGEGWASEDKSFTLVKLDSSVFELRDSSGKLLYTKMK